MITTQQRQRQHGAVSLFVVIFATLLMIIITISFIQLMIKDQQQATASDLSQSAYDSAKSGVEDAKRLLLVDQECRKGIGDPAYCMSVANAIDSDDCNTVSKIFGSDTDKETLIQQNEKDEALNQAYTCVKINATTADYKGISGVNSANIVPLKSVREFNKVRISWFTTDDIASATNSMTVTFPPTGATVNLPTADRWGVSTPALLRTQLMQTGTNFKLSDADDKSNASTLFLYPSTLVGPTLDFNNDVRRDGTQAPEIVKCISTFTTSKKYACEATISLPDPADGNKANRNAFLRLGTLYNGAHYKVEMLDAGGAVVDFDRVQPEVDSTGRANDMFRRVKSRVEFKSDFIYPEAAIDLEGNLCKSFTITDKPDGYVNNCTP